MILISQNIVQIIVHFLSNHWAHCSIFVVLSRNVLQLLLAILLQDKFENGVLLLYTLEGVSSIANFITVYEESQ